MAQRTSTLGRGQMLRAIPKHLLWAALSGALVCTLLYWVVAFGTYLPDWIALVILGALLANAAVLPVALPGRHWSFAFISAMMLFLALVAGMILAAKFPFPHSQIACAPGYRNFSAEVNIITWVAIITGGCLGLFYGLLVGRTSSMVVGLSLGSAAGYVLGVLAVHAVSWYIAGAGSDGDSIYVSRLRYGGPLHFAWQGALAMVALHLGASLGAAMGAGPAADAAANRQS